jgi:hypothetical protein
MNVDRGGGNRGAAFAVPGTGGKGSGSRGGEVGGTRRGAASSLARTGSESQPDRQIKNGKMCSE